MKIGAQKTEFQGALGAGDEKKSETNQQIEKIYKITRTGPIPGPDIRTGRTSKVRSPAKEGQFLEKNI